MDNLLEVVWGARLTRNAVAATYALLLFEFLTVLDREYQTVYKSRWSLGKVLYLICRFCPLILWPVVMYAYMLDHDIAFCKSVIIIISVILILLLSVPQCIYTLRAWAFMGATKQSLFLFLPCLFGHFFVLLWFAFYDMPVDVFDIGFNLLGQTGCFPGFPHGYNEYSRFMFAGIALDTVLGLIVTIHCIRMNMSQTRLGKLLQRQVLLYLPLMLGLDTMAAIVTTVGNFRGYDGMVLSSVVAMSNILACRFVLQIREFATAEPDTEYAMSILKRDSQHPPPPPSTVDPERCEAEASAAPRKANELQPASAIEDG